MPATETFTASPYELAEELASDARYRLYRGRCAADPGAVLLKVPAHGPTHPEDVAGLKREYEILRKPPIDALTRALDLVCDDRFCALVLEDRGERTLASLMAARSTSIGWVLDYALQMVAALAGLHRAGIVHRGLSPRSVLVHGETGRIRLTDFADAARNPAEASLPLARHQYRTRLPYAAPEQTGRVNRACDYRTDFYSLGALLYELLTGRPPFVADDPIELMHAHLARQPVAPFELAAAVPLVLSQIVLKLLAKEPEERYQSARSLADDLDRCRREWTERGRVAQFPIAARDVSDRFSLPNRLFGREEERAQLGAAFERARAGASMLVLVEGPAGIGKTALIRELQGPVLRRRGHFVSGKFDQLSREVPYGALSQALRQRILHTLAAPPLHIGRERDRLAAELGAHAAVIAELVPELEQLLGAVPPAPWLPAAEAQNRFTLAFRNFVAALATEDAPLVIFLDDLQWADASTLQLLAALLTNPASHHLLLIGAYRTASAGDEPTLARTFAELEAEHVDIQRLLLGPLARGALEQFAQAALQRDDSQATALAGVLEDKTLGNPFFVTQFLVALHQDGAIAFDRQQWSWTCRMDLVEGMSITDNVVDLLSRKLDRLPASVQRVLTLAACVGNRFGAGTLATVCELPLRAIQDELDVATRAGLIAPQSDGGFVFLHDRVQQAAYARIDAADRPRVHLLVGRLLWAEHAEDGSDIGGFDGIFETASHLNLGARLIDDAGERLALARLNRTAGAKAKAAAAYRAALGYFAAGLELLEPGHWRTEYALAFDLHFEAAQCEYLCGDFDAAARDFDALLARAANDLDRAKVVSLRAIHHENLGRYDAALASAREALALLDMVLPATAVAKDAALQAQIAAIEQRLGGRAIASLVDLPALTDPTLRMVMRILVGAWSPAYILGDATLARLLSATLVRLSLEHGNTEESAYGYVTHAITAGPVRGDYAAAGEWGALALAVNARFDDRRLRAKVYQQFHAHVEPWRSPFARCVEHAREACRSGLESGDFLYAAYGASTEAWPAFAASQDLAQFVRDLEPNLALVQQLKNPPFADALRLMMGWARALQETGTPITLSGPDFDEQHYVATYRDNPFFSMFHAIARLHVCFTLDDAAGAAEAAGAVRATAASLTGMLWSVQFEFWNGMRVAAAFADAGAAQRAEALATLQAAVHSLAVLAESCPANYRCFALLLQAELARVNEQPYAAMVLYEQAIASADEAQHVQQQALANERCGRLWLERGNRNVAALYLQAALEHYARWGAHAKVRSLMAGHAGLPGLASARLSEQADDPLARSVHQAFDFATLGRAAQAITESDQLGAALRQMLSIAIQNAGASRGVLIEVRDGEPFVLAEGGAENRATTSLSDVALHAAPARCSAAIVNAVLRKDNCLIVTDPALDARFAHDEYLAAQRPRSVLCVGAMHQGQPAAILYLENSFAREAFSADRIEVIQILAAQAALSLVSGRMLDRMQREMAERLRAEQQVRVIDEGLSAVTGGEFFRSLVRNLARALQVRYAFVAECVPAPAGVVARACAFWDGDDFGPAFEYKLAGTPCQKVVEGRKICHFASDLQALFPGDRALGRWDAHSYLGMPLVGSNDQVIGHLVVLDTGPMPDAAVPISLLRLSAGRAGAELERLKADQGLQQALAQVEDLKNRLQEENVYLRRELIANVSHDLRSPLASLRGYLETLLIKEKTLTAADRHSYLSIAARQAEHLQKLISELFDLARLDFEGYRIAAEPLHLGELARDVLQKFQLMAEGKGVTLELEVDDALGFVQADIGLIERTLENLLGNAIAHTPAAGGVCLQLSGRAQGVQVEVRDTGVGIPGEDLPRIFERFYRGDKARSLASEGSGLGLAIVKRIVELHGSEIRVESTVGAGTRFWFTLRRELTEI